MAGRTHLRLAYPPPNYPPTPFLPTHPLINDTHDITAVVKKLSQKPAVNTVWQELATKH